MFEEQDREKLKMGELTVEYFDYGKGKPMVMLHGYPDTPRTFIHQVRAFNQAGYRVICPFLPGYGHTCAPLNGHFSLLDMASLLDTFIAELVPSEQVVIYGNNWGAAIAELIGCLHQTSTESAYALHAIILGAFSLRNHAAQKKKNQSIFDRLKTLYRERHAFINAIPNSIELTKRNNFQYIRHLRARWSPMTSHDDPNTQTVIDLFKHGDNYRNATLFFQYLMNKKYRLLVQAQITATENLLTLPPKIPTLMVYGEEDGLITQAHFKQCRHLYHGIGSSVIRIPMAGHFLHYDNPKAFNHVALTYLNANLVTATNEPILEDDQQETVNNS